jgi:hypothetical protein
MDLNLLPYEPAFLEAFIEWRNQPLSVRHNPLQAMSVEEIAQMLSSQGAELAQLRAYESYRWFISVDRQVVGAVSLKNISHSMGYGEIGYGLAESHHWEGNCDRCSNVAGGEDFSRNEPAPVAGLCSRGKRRLMPRSGEARLSGGRFAA